MAFKLIALSALLAVASAGGPAAYNIATATGDYHSAGYTQESTHKGYAGQNVISSFSKAVDSPHSSVRVSNSRVTNDALYSHSVAPAISYAAPAYNHAVSYAAPAAPAYGYAAAPVVAKYAAPAYGYASHAVPHYSAAPAVSYSSVSTPVIAKAAYAAPAYSYAPAAPVVAKYAAAPAYSYAPAAPVVAKYAAAPAYSYAPAAPVVAKYAAAPAYGYAAGAPVVHTTFQGLGAHYAW